MTNGGSSTTIMVSSGIGGILLKYGISLKIIRS
jgi:hypothetical protein